jgi:hypothetical protein
MLCWYSSVQIPDALAVTRSAASEAQWIIQEASKRDYRDYRARLSGKGGNAASEQSFSVNNSNPISRKKTDYNFLEHPLRMRLLFTEGG